MRIFADRGSIFFERIETYVRDPARQPRRESVRVGIFYMQKEKFDGTTTIEASWKIHSHRTFIFFYFLKVCRFCLYKDRPGSWPAVWHNEKRLRFVSNADFLIHGPATLPISQIASSASHFVFFFWICFFLNSSILSISVFPARRMIRAQSHGKFFPLEPPSSIFLHFLLSPSFFLFALNKYRFRLSELTPVSALYPFLTRIEFRTEDRSLSVAIFSEAQDHFPPFFFFSVERCWPAGPEVRRCVCPKGDFDQTQSIPLNLHAHPRRALRREKIVQMIRTFIKSPSSRWGCASKINDNLRCITR